MAIGAPGESGPLSAIDNSPHGSNTNTLSFNDLILCYRDKAEQSSNGRLPSAGISKLEHLLHFAIGESAESAGSQFENLGSLVYEDKEKLLSEYDEEKIPTSEAA